MLKAGDSPHGSGSGGQRARWETPRPLGATSQGGNPGGPGGPPRGLLHGAQPGGQDSHPRLQVGTSGRDWGAGTRVLGDNGVEHGRVPQRPPPGRSAPGAPSLPGPMFFGGPLARSPHEAESLAGAARVAHLSPRGPLNHHGPNSQVPSGPDGAPPSARAAPHAAPERTVCSRPAPATWSPSSLKILKLGAVFSEPTPVFLPGESHGQRSLAVYIRSMGSKESDKTSIQSLSPVRLFATCGLQHARPPCPPPTP